MPKNNKNIDMGKIMDQRNREAVETLKKIPSQLVDTVSGMLGNEQAPPAVSPDLEKIAEQMGSYFGTGNKPMLGEIDTGGMSIEEVQKAQDAEKKKQQLKQYLQLQKQMQEPPMEVPKARAEALDPRLANPENLKRFQNMVNKIKQNK
jgi:hypothetical protein